ncbi:MAG: glycoside hydrolase family 31 protein [Bacteroidota bacterium]|nr:glycoside hydrolase family 31 protein [Bacteroidota bacterium]
MTHHTTVVQSRNIVLLLLSLFFSFTILTAKEILGKYSSHKREGKSIIVSSQQGERLRVTPYGKYMIRIQAVRDSEEFFADDRYEMVESHQWPGSLILLEDSTSLTASTDSSDGLAVRIEKKALRFSFGKSGSAFEFLHQSDGICWDGDTIHSSFAYDASEHFAGLGHGYFGRGKQIDLRGEVVQRNYGTQHGQQAPLLVPFYLSSKGYGVFLNSTFPNTFKFGANGEYEFSIAGEGRMDYFVILGPEFKNILDRYTQLTGRPRFFPQAAFGLALSDKGNDHTSTAPSDEKWWKEKIIAHRNAGFPLDHIINDNRWRAGGGQRCISYFEWDRGRYPDPKEYEQWVKSNGLILTIDFNRCIASHSEGWKPSFNIPQPDSIDFNDSAPDFTKKEVRDWFWNIFWTKSVDPALGFPGDAFWIDEFDEMGKAPLSMVMGNGRTWREMKNYWFFLIAKSLVQDGWDKNFNGTKRPFVWVRGMTAGAQRYATLWSGDIKPSYDEMKMQIRGLQFAGLAGFPFWGHDAGGFNNWEENHGPNDNMYRQWSMAFGSFTPFWKPHGIGQSRWPLDRPPIVQKDAKVYSELRYKLMPYIYTYAHHSTESGMPIARAMVIDHQNDSLAWKYDLQYMWGNEMLVAPNCSDSNKVTVWLPEGNWYDFWNDDIIKGNQIISYPAPTGKLPLFIKAGSIIPMGNYAVSTAFLKKDSLTVHVYTGSDASFNLYEDDGVTEHYRTNNEKRTTKITFTQSDFSLAIDSSVGSFTNAPVNRAVRIEFHGIQKQICLAANGVKLKTYKSEREAMAAREGIVWNKKKNILSVFLKSTLVTKPIVISSIKNCQ